MSTTELSDLPQGHPIPAHDQQYHQSSDSKQSRPPPYPDRCTFNFIQSIPEGEKVSRVPPTHEHLGPAMDWDKFLNIGWEQRLDEARWPKPKVSEATV
jgi:hypothetical protein